MSDQSAPEYRRDPVTGRLVIVAPARSGRPIVLDHAAPHHRAVNDRSVCPFCEGREDLTPGELLADRDPGSPANGPGWRLRVVPNKFPAVTAAEGVDAAARQRGLFDSFPAVGAHELVIECARHESDPTKLTDAEFAAMLRAYRERLAALAADPRFDYASVFKNVGAEAGASLAHLHSQILATAVIPDGVRLELDMAAERYRWTGRCVFCEVIDHERDAGVRVVAESEHFVALTPFAGRFDYEVWVFPTAHFSGYEALTDPRADELAVFLKRVLGKLDAVLRQPAYNYALHTAPLRVGPRPDFHWHLEITPRTARAAGFEWGSGCFIVTVSPEQAAAELRAAEPRG
jgi:UDPglucose--hexose-1-phosphate uridylyltransferase